MNNSSVLRFAGWRHTVHFFWSEDAMKLTLPGLFLGVLFWLVIVVLLLGGGLGIGYLLHRLLPAVELGTGMLIGVIVIPVAFRAWMALTSTLTLPLEVLEDEAEDWQGSVLPEGSSRRPTPASSASSRKRRRLRKMERSDGPPRAT